MQHFWVVGTDTDVGKTFVTTLFLRELQKTGIAVTPYKPVQTGIVADDGQGHYQDTSSYKDYSLYPLDNDLLNTYSFPVAASPHYAAELAGHQIDEKLVLQTIENLKVKFETVICEGAGGLLVPLHSNTKRTLLDVVEQSDLPVVLVASTKLGTINHTLLSIEALQARGISVQGIVFNQFNQTPLEQNNMETIRRFTGLPSVVIKANSTIESFTDVPVLEGLMSNEV
ncbi:dethiobiotin synthase [Sporosarcina sp. BI001-red]|uniref:dethiobiotin synthase n=1 Tax=Sporosarcina sp. BI001-red TaxID=2282866 RepID=UPI000E22FD9B|nr:dethiobiotin synthase [Sporosarcina sp. BI001-red]REB08075.1 dethiobiotin synthase [Sporosarcina sp. BI001-red]